MSRQIDLQTVLSDDELEYLESRGRDGDLAVNAAFLINKPVDDGDADGDADSAEGDADSADGDADSAEGDADKTGDPPEPVSDDQKLSAPTQAQTSTATRAPAKKS